MKKTTVSSVKCSDGTSALLVNGKVITTHTEHHEILNAAERIAASMGTWVNHGKYKARKDWTWDDLQANVKYDTKKANPSRAKIPGITGDHDAVLYQLCKLVKTKFSKKAPKTTRAESLETLYYYKANEYSFEITSTELQKHTKLSKARLNPLLADLSKLGYIRRRQSGGLKITITDKARTLAYLYDWFPVENLQEPGTLSGEQIAIVERLLDSTKFALKFDTLQKTFASFVPDIGSNSDRLPWSYYWLVKSNIVRVINEGPTNARVITMVLGAPRQLDGVEDEMVKSRRSKTGKQKRNRSETTDLTPVHERFLEGLIRLTVEKGYPPTQAEAKILKDKDTSELFKVPYFKLRELINSGWVSVDAITDTVELKPKAVNHAVASMKIARKKTEKACGNQHPSIIRKNQSILNDIRKMPAA